MHINDNNPPAYIVIGFVPKDGLYYEKIFFEKDQAEKFIDSKSFYGGHSLSYRPNPIILNDIAMPYTIEQFHGEVDAWAGDYEFGGND